MPSVSDTSAAPLPPSIPPGAKDFDFAEITQEMEDRKEFVVEACCGLTPEYWKEFNRREARRAHQARQKLKLEHRKANSELVDRIADEIGTVVADMDVTSSLAETARISSPTVLENAPQQTSPNLDGTGTEPDDSDVDKDM